MVCPFTGGPRHAAAARIGDETISTLSRAPDGRLAPVTIIVPTFNRSSLIGEALQSLLSQTVAPAQLIVLDDGSTDDTESVVRSISSEIVYVRQENQGKAAALNHALALASGDYVWIFDDDDLARPDALAVLLDALNQHADCGFAYGAYENFGFNADGERWQYRVETPVVSSDTLFISLLERCFVFQGGMLVRRSCYGEVGLFDETLVRSQDYDMLLRLSRRFKACRVDQVVYSQRQHVGVRGTLKEPVSVDKVEEAWIRYDAAIMDKLLPTLQEVDYLPAGGPSELDHHMRAEANLQKFVVLARKSMWAKAFEALEFYDQAISAEGASASLTLHQKMILSRVFDGYSRAFTAYRQDENLKAALAHLRFAHLRRQFRMAMAEPLPLFLRMAIRRREKHQVQKGLGALIALRGLPFAAAKMGQILLGIAKGRLTGNPDGGLAKLKPAI
ncbi:MAG: glycosyltransferase family 2 protein [Caulobacteraceae bacterium]